MRRLMHCLTVITISCILTVTEGGPCNRNDATSMCVGGTVRGPRLFVEADVKPSDNVARCNCTATLRKLTNDGTSKNLDIFSLPSWSSCDYRLKMTRPGITGTFGCVSGNVNAVSFTLSNNDAVNIELEEEDNTPRAKTVSECLLLSLPQGTTDAEIDFTCQAVLAPGTQPTTSFAPTSQPTTTQAPTTQPTTSLATSTQPTTERVPTTQPTTTRAQSTPASVTQPTTTPSPSTQASITQPTTTPSPSTQVPTTGAATMPTVTAQADTPEGPNSSMTQTVTETMGTPNTPVNASSNRGSAGVDQSRVPGKVTKDDSLMDIIIPVGTGVGVFLLIVAVVAVLLYQKCRSGNEAPLIDENDSPVAKDNGEPIGAVNSGYVQEEQPTSAYMTEVDPNQGSVFDSNPPSDVPALVNSGHALDEQPMTEVDPNQGSVFDSNPPSDVPVLVNSGYALDEQPTTEVDPNQGSLFDSNLPTDVTALDDVVVQSVPPVDDNQFNEDNSNNRETGYDDPSQDDAGLNNVVVQSDTPSNTDYVNIDIQNIADARVAKIHQTEQE